MCRWLVYRGPAVPLRTLLLDPANSLLDQSLAAREIEWPTNGDGFGIGWYGSRDQPGLFRDVLPIWNDLNLLELADQIDSGLFFAHIRKATGGAIQRTNCHPFRHGRWLFQHNGSIPQWSRLKQRLYSKISPELFPSLQGSTDSECMFLIALTMGLERDPPTALRDMIRIVEQARQEDGIERPFQCSISVSDGETVWAIRHASHGTPRSLYYSRHPDAVCDLEGCATSIPEEGVIIASEPLGEVGETWHAIEPGGLLTVGADGVEVQRLDL